MAMQSGPSARSQEARSAARTHLLALREARLNRRRGKTKTAEILSAGAAPSKFMQTDSAPSGSVQTEVDTGTDSLSAIAADDTLPTPGAIDVDDAADADDDIAIPTPAARITQDTPPEAPAMMTPQEAKAPDTPDALAAAPSMPAPSMPESEKLPDGPDAPALETEETAPLSEPEGQNKESAPTASEPQEVSAPLTDPCPELDTAPSPKDSRAPLPDPAPDNPGAAADPLAGLPGAGPGLIWMLNRAGIVTLADLATADTVELSRKLGLLGEILDLETWITQAQTLQNS